MNKRTRKRKFLEMIERHSSFLSLAGIFDEFCFLNCSSYLLKNEYVIHGTSSFFATFPPLPSIKIFIPPHIG